MACVFFCRVRQLLPDSADSALKRRAPAIGYGAYQYQCLVGAQGNSVTSGEVVFFKLSFWLKMGLKANICALYAKQRRPSSYPFAASCPELSGQLATRDWGGWLRRVSILCREVSSRE